MTRAGLTGSFWPNSAGVIQDNILAPVKNHELSREEGIEPQQPPPRPAHGRASLKENYMNRRILTCRNSSKRSLTENESPLLTTPSEQVMRAGGFVAGVAPPMFSM